MRYGFANKEEEGLLLGLSLEGRKGLLLCLLDTVRFIVHKGVDYANFDHTIASSWHVEGVWYFAKVSYRVRGLTDADFYFHELRTLTDEEADELGQVKTPIYEARL